MRAFFYKFVQPFLINFFCWTLSYSFILGSLSCPVFFIKNNILVITYNTIVALVIVNIVRILLFVIQRLCIYSILDFKLSNAFICNLLFVEYSVLRFGVFIYYAISWNFLYSILASSSKSIYRYRRLLIRYLGYSRVFVALLADLFCRRTVWVISSIRYSILKK